MRTLVTGGAGFIGSHVVERLLGEGRQVTVLDDLSTGALANLPDAGERLRVVRGDVADPAAVAGAMEGCDDVIHLAAIASVQASLEDPLGTHRTNLQGTLTVLEAAARERRRVRVTYASSAAVYGDARDLPVQEDAPKRPLSPYAVDKLAGEHYLAIYHRAGHVAGVTLRFFNVFGPRQDPSSPYSGVISVFAARAARRRPLVVHGDGGQTRDFVYVADVVEALVRAGRLEPAAELPVANVGCGRSVSVRELAMTVLELARGAPPSPAELLAAPAREGDIRHSVADTARLRELLGFVPTTGLREGLERMVATPA